MKYIMTAYLNTCEREPKLSPKMPPSSQFCSNLSDSKLVCTFLVLAHAKNVDLQAMIIERERGIQKVYVYMSFEYLPKYSV